MSEKENKNTINENLGNVPMPEKSTTEKAEKYPETVGYVKTDPERSTEPEIEEERDSWLLDKARSFLAYGLAIGAIVVHGVSVFLNNIAGGHEHFQPGRVFAQVISSFEMKEERKKLKERASKSQEEEQKQKNEKETPEKRGKEIEEKIAEAESTKAERSEEPLPPNTTEYHPPLSSADLVPSNTITAQTPELWNLEQKVENTIRGTAKNKENLHLVVSELLIQPSVKSIFSELHLTPVCPPDKDEIYLFSDDTEMDIKNIPTLEKEALLYGNASHLASAIYESQELSEGASVACAAKALIAAVKIKSEVFSRDFNDMRNLLTLEKPERYVVANTICETEKDHGAMYAALSYKENYVDLYYKDSFVTSVNITEPMEQSLYEIKQRVAEIDKEKDTMVYQFGKDIIFHKEENSVLSLTIHGTTKEFSIKEEFDLKTVADYITEQCPERSETADIDAMLMGLAINPYMNRSVDEAEIEMNPFTNQQKYTSDLVIGHKNGLHYISEQQLEESTLGKGYRQEPIACVQPYGTPMDFEKLEEIVITYRQEHPAEEHNEEFLIKNSMADFLHQTDIVKDVASPATQQGYVAWKKLKEESILDGTDLSQFKFIKNPEPEREETSFSKEDFELYEMSEEMQEEYGAL